MPRLSEFLDPLAAWWAQWSAASEPEASASAPPGPLTASLAGTPWRWPARTKAPAPVTVSERDPVANLAQWRAAQLPDIQKLGEETAAWDWRTHARPPGPETAKLDESMVSGGPIGLNAPGAAFGGILRKPLTQTKVKYEHPVTGEEPTRVFHGTKHDFPEFNVTKADPAGLYGPGIYFTESPKTAAGYAGQPLQVNYDEWVKAGLEAEMPRPNIRPAHLDIRKPFDIDAKIPPEEARRILTSARHPISFRERNLADYTNRSLTGNELYSALASGPGRSRAEANAALQAAGYDGITHMGGAITGTKPHRVWIAFDPKQVISPFEYAAQGEAR